MHGTSTNRAGQSAMITRPGKAFQLESVQNRLWTASSVEIENAPRNRWNPSTNGTLGPEKSFHDSWSFISGTGLCTFPAQPRRSSDVEKRSRTETIEPKINKLRMTVSAAKRSWKEKPQPITNNRQTAGGDCVISSFSKLHNFWVRYSKLGKYNQIYHRKSIEIHWFMK